MGPRRHDQAKVMPKSRLSRPSRTHGPLLVLRCLMLGHGTLILHGSLFGLVWMVVVRGACGSCLAVGRSTEECRESNDGQDARLGEVGDLVASSPSLRHYSRQRTLHTPAPSRHEAAASPTSITDIVECEGRQQAERQRQRLALGILIRILSPSRQRQGVARSANGTGNGTSYQLAPVPIPSPSSSLISSRLLSSRLSCLPFPPSSLPPRSGQTYRREIPKPRPVPATGARMQCFWVAVPAWSPLLSQVQSSGRVRYRDVPQVRAEFCTPSSSPKVCTPVVRNGGCKPSSVLVDCWHAASVAPLTRPLGLPNLSAEIPTTTLLCHHHSKVGTKPYAQRGRGHCYPHTISLSLAPSTTGRRGP
jgi:hypothetical protein